MASYEEQQAFFVEHRRKGHDVEMSAVTSRGGRKKMSVYCYTCNEHGPGDIEEIKTELV